MKRKHSAVVLWASTLALVLASCAPAWAKEGNVVAIPEGGISAHYVEDSPLVGRTLAECTIPGGSKALVDRKTYWEDALAENNYPLLISLVLPDSEICEGRPVVDSAVNLEVVDSTKRQEVIDELCEKGRFGTSESADLLKQLKVEEGSYSKYCERK